MRQLERCGAPYRFSALSIAILGVFAASEVDAQDVKVIVAGPQGEPSGTAASLPPIISSRDIYDYIRQGKSYRLAPVKSKTQNRPIAKNNSVGGSVTCRDTGLRSLSCTTTGNVSCDYPSGFNNRRAVCTPIDGAQYPVVTCDESSYGGFYDGYGGPYDGIVQCSADNGPASELVDAQCSSIPTSLTNVSPFSTDGFCNWDYPTLLTGPASIVHPPTNIGSNNDQSFTITSTGLEISQIVDVASSNSQFTVTPVDPDPCNSNAPGFQCQYAVRFQPTAVGLVTGTLTFKMAGITYLTIPISGTGLGGGNLTGPASVNFGATNAGTPVAQAITLNVTASSSFVVGAASISGVGFQLVTDGCVNTYTANATCPVSLRFTPPGVGTFTGQLTINHAGGTSPLVIPLSGVGTPGQAYLTLTPEAATFEVSELNTVRSDRAIRFTATNPGTASFGIGGIVLSNDYSIQSNRCIGSVAAGDSCTIDVLFVPKTGGLRPGALSIKNASGDVAASSNLIGLGRQNEEVCK
jgi:hypothetical protein